MLQRVNGSVVESVARSSCSGDRYAAVISLASTVEECYVAQVEWRKNREMQRN